MCGIAVLISLDGSTRSLQEILDMTDIIRHRGPDDEGFVLLSTKCELSPLHFGGAETPDCVYDSEIAHTPEHALQPDLIKDGYNIAFGHRRLSIIDLSPSGHQPMSYAGGRYWITYNGEVYNYRELRQELEALGHTFISGTDTEVILASYAQWGHECLHRFNGMWAFIIFDRETSSIFAARDRFGVKPLYFWIRDDDTIAFASEIKQFTVLRGWTPRLNGQRAYDFLRYSLIDHTPETMFAGVYQVPGGMAIECPITDLLPHPPVFRWYEMNYEPFKGTFGDAAEELRRLLKDSIQLRLRADVNVGSCLSGGLDSSTIVCIVDELVQGNHPEGLSTFSACTGVVGFDERQYMDEVIDSRHLKAYYIYSQLDELFDHMEEITWHQDEPNQTTSLLFQWKIFKLAQEVDVKVMLDGQGADEILAGYHGFFIPRLQYLFKNLKFYTLINEIQALKALHGSGYQYSMNMLFSPLILNFLRGIPRLGEAIDGRAVPPWIDMNRLNAEPRNPVVEADNVEDNVRNYSEWQLFRASLPILLHYEDRNSMAHSVESRVPFLDVRIVEFLIALPDDYKIADGTTKRVLRQSMKGILPDRICNRMDKMGFVSPEALWVLRLARDRFRSALECTVTLSNGIITDTVLELFDDMVNEKRPWDPVIIRLVMFGIWLKQFRVLT